MTSARADVSSDDVTNDVSKIPSGAGGAWAGRADLQVVHEGA